MRSAASKGAGVTGVVTLAVLAVLIWFEYRRPLRHPVESKTRHLARNLTVAGLSAAAVRLVESPVILPLAGFVERRGIGLVPTLGLPPWAAVPLVVVLMDYTLYVWHVLTHRVPFLWRFHIVHHVDRDLDASTALRFHFAEILISIPWRAAQVLVIGASPLAFGAWQAFLMLSILFHHSNVRLPYSLERRLVRIIVTPRMHGIHHSFVRAETDSNWSSGLTVWDRIHGTLRLSVSQAAVEIGVPAYHESSELTLSRILSLPFQHQRRSWELPGGGTPIREETPGAPTHLMP